MIFTNRLAKFGKGENLAAIMNTPTLISIYFFERGIARKDVKLDGDSMTLERVKVSLPYRQVIPIDQTTLVTRLDKSIGVFKYEQ